MFDTHGGWRRAATLQAVLLTLVSCSAPDRPSTPEPTGSRQTLHATAREFAFEPDTWTVDGGKPATLTFTNDGAVGHEWVLMNTPIAEEMEFHEDLVLFEVESAPGETVEGEFRSLARGEYQVICAVPGHFTAGMRGTLKVQ